MDPRLLFIDERLRNVCANCHEYDPSTQDHNPSKVFLDKPYPDDLPTVPMCRECNESFSSDEQYVACLIECAVTGFESIHAIQRPNIRRIMESDRVLMARLQAARSLTSKEAPIFEVDMKRMIGVVTKLARGHINFELSNVMDRPADIVTVTTITQLSDQQRALFVANPEPTVLPEIGSRQFLSLLFVEGAGIYSEGWSDWKIIQPNRYQYVVEQEFGDSVRILLSNYLCCEVIWE